ncbi:hypothetical protein BGP_0254 [Beggiatoa sp. PS]|nr:hypothetical protein BGP_0254 [Beggiatoa sp. PS]
MLEPEIDAPKLKLWTPCLGFGLQSHSSFIIHHSPFMSIPILPATPLLYEKAMQLANIFHLSVVDTITISLFSRLAFNDRAFGIT